MFEVVLLQERGSVDAGELGALIQVDQNLACGFPAPHGDEQGLQNQIAGLAALHRPTDEASLRGLPITRLR